MRLTLNLNGSAEPFINYLKNFLRIRESLLIEIDTSERAFVAKTLAEDKSSIRFASLRFEDAFVTIVSDDGEEERGEERINIGVLIKLKKLIQIVERFGSDVNSKGESNFNIVLDYGIMEIVDKDTKQRSDRYVATEIKFTSPILTMKMAGFRVAEFKFISDERFMNTVFNVSDPVSINITRDCINSIVKTSDIIKIDPRKDALIFYAEGNVLFVRDQGEGKEKTPNFVYRLGELDSEPTYDVTVPVSREKFIKMMDKCDEDFKMILGHVNSPDYGFRMDRILFDSESSATKIVVAAMCDC